MSCRFEIDSPRFLERVPTWTYEKTNRIGAETSNVQAVMDGDIDMFIQAKLRGEKAGEG